MLIKALALGAAAALTVTPAFAAKVMQPTAPIPYDQLSAIDAQMNGGYNSRGGKHKRTMHTSSAASASADTGASSQTTATPDAGASTSTDAGAGAGADTAAPAPTTGAPADGAPATDNSSGSAGAQPDAGTTAPQ